jgi:membrane-bound inhibitor of C-type lysozyme
MRHGPLPVLTAAALALAACDPPAEEPPAAPVQPSSGQPAASTMPIVGYACESGQTVGVQYVDDATARVTYKGATADLRLTPSGSGARYSGAEWEWWSATRDGQEQATLGRVGPNDQVGVTILERCTRPTSGGAAPGPLPGQPGQPGMAPTSGSPCRGPQLQLAAEASDAGAGSRETVFSLRNVGTQACTLQGHVGLTLQDAQGRDLTAVRTDRVDDGGGSFSGTAAPVVLPPQGKAFFGLRWNVVPNEAAGQRTCPTATRVSVTAPGDTSPTSLSQTFTPCGGRVSVTPLRATRTPDVTPQVGP